MRFSSVATALAVSSLAAGYPGMGNTIGELKRMALERRDNGTQVELIGDLATKGATTPVGKTVVACLQDQIDCYDDLNKVS
jgi:hypothetical protein